MFAHILGVPVEELTPLVYGGSAGWLLLYVCGRIGAAADRLAGRRERPEVLSGSSATPPGRSAPGPRRAARG